MKERTGWEDAKLSLKQMCSPAALSLNLCACTLLLLLNKCTHFPGTLRFPC